MTDRVYYPDIKTSQCERCIGVGCTACRTEGSVPHCDCCGGTAPDYPETSDRAFDAWLAFLGGHFGMCPECVIESERADTERAPLLDHLSAPSGHFVDDPDLADSEASASYDASGRTVSKVEVGSSTRSSHTRAAPTSPLRSLKERKVS